ncbi:ABC transporter permease subunit [Streptomyces sp. NPDC060184]|uniref:ABC transporter permease subunit n=1 Tax=Streptomyces sp. NPDC060184 TaxID=3347064 RepID=UPI003659FF92
MSTLAPPRPSPRTTASAGLRGPARLVVRQHRRAFQLLILLTALTAAGLVAVALWAGHDADVFARTGCRVDTVTTDACTRSTRAYDDSQYRLNHSLSVVALLTAVLSAAYGAFMAGPALARELESGTHRLAWTQSVSPARWLTAKLAVPAALTVACTLVLTTVCTWFSTRGTLHPLYWHDTSVYGTTGVYPFAQALCGLALGTLAGLLLRRAFAAMALAAAAQGIAVHVLQNVRGHLWPVVHGPYALARSNPFPRDAWMTEVGYLTGTGERLPMGTCFPIRGKFGDCLDSLGVTRRYADYHPKSHYWPLQLVESGILLAVAALAVYAAHRLLRRLHA